MTDPRDILAARLTNRKLRERRAPRVGTGKAELCLFGGYGQGRHFTPRGGAVALPLPLVAIDAAHGAAGRTKRNRLVHAHALVGAAVGEAGVLGRAGGVLVLECAAVAHVPVSGDFIVRLSVQAHGRGKHLVVAAGDVPLPTLSGGAEGTVGAAFAIAADAPSLIAAAGEAGHGAGGGATARLPVLELLASGATGYDARGAADMVVPIGAGCAAAGAVGRASSFMAIHALGAAEHVEPAPPIEPMVGRGRGAPTLLVAAGVGEFNEPVPLPEPIIGRGRSLHLTLGAEARGESEAPLPLPVSVAGIGRLCQFSLVAEARGEFEAPLPLPAPVAGVGRSLHLALGAEARGEFETPLPLLAPVAGVGRIRQFGLTAEAHGEFVAPEPLPEPISGHGRITLELSITLGAVAVAVRVARATADLPVLVAQASGTAAAQGVAAARLPAPVARALLPRQAFRLRAAAVGETGAIGKGEAFAPLAGGSGAGSTGARGLIRLVSVTAAPRARAHHEPDDVEAITAALLAA